MEAFSNNLTARLFDKVLEHANVSDMLENTNERPTAGQIAIEYLNRTAAAKNITREALAHKLGIARQTVTARFVKHSMTIDDFINTAQALDTDPAKVIAESVALADEEAKS